MKRFIFIAICSVSSLSLSLQAAPIREFRNLVIRAAYGSDPVDVQLDLNRDGVPDVLIHHREAVATGVFFQGSEDTITGLNGTAIALGGSTAAALPFGQSVGPALTFSAANATKLILNTDSRGAGSFTDGFGFDGTVYAGAGAFFNPNAAVGVQIPVSGQNYYAWFSFQSTQNSDQDGFNALLVTQSGYETSPGTAVAIAPEPTAISILGISTLVILGRRRNRPCT